MFCFRGWIDENVKPKTSAVQNFVTCIDTASYPFTPVLRFCGIDLEKNVIICCVKYEQ